MKVKVDKKKRSNFSGVIFDIDGTLVSSNDVIFESFRYVVKRYLGKTISNEEIISLFGPPEDIILKQWMGDNYEKARIDYYEFYEKKHDSMVKTIPHIKELLNDIKNAEIPLGVFTGKGRLSSLITLKKTGLYKFFDLIVTGDDVKSHKPSAEGINKFLKVFNLDAVNVLMVGDAPSDVFASREAGCKIATVLWDCYALEQVKKLDSDYYIETADELRKIIFA